jgi:trk system potassium uptake protein TrkH
MVWIAAIWISAIPWTIKWATTEPYCTEYNLWQIITQSVFEMTSGYTTTGLSVVDVDATLEAGGELFLFFRAFTQFIGGVGLLLVLTSAISDVRGISAYTLEGHNDKLLPNIVRSARLIFAIYLFYLAIGVAAYCGVGMPWFDALTTAMAAIATGGFHIRSVSISYYSSLPYGQVPVEIITEVLMLLGSTNFLVHYYFLRGRWNKAFRHFEFGVLLMAFVLIYPWMAVGMAYHYMASPYNLDWASSWGMGCRVGFFEFMNAITGTGFTLVGTATNPFGASDSYMSLPGYVYMCLIVVMVIGGETGSTSGGIKQSRVAYTWLAVKESFYRMTHRQNVYHTRYFYRYGQKEVYDVREAASTIVFIIVYFLVAISATVLLSLDVNLEGYTNAGEQWTFGECFFEITSALATVGISAGVTSASAPTFSLWVMTLCMFLGRLEILIVFNFFRQVFRDAHHSIEKRVSRRKMAVK